ncbi:flagellar hook-associated protein FlgL [Ectothiorhodospira lacustris]|uniref:flagellar hook-associated protein FlgL n=1 Tax=Ectothiorhodospira lacustris TaxID=2899127 RepID=UPI001EE7ABE5|nr:flagellar hook-associated protein FlgL [Ectothiorhodospira lacustris]MCG5499827.1 flagellar hook-associated protein FlgL [Ectothiorhodospira lacustris]
MRISTTQMFQNGIDTMQRRQAEMSRTQNQLGTGRRILSPSDDPSGSVQTLQFESRIQQSKQFQRNGTLAEQRLRLTEVTMAAMNNGLHRVRTLAVQANNATQTPETRGYIALEMRQVMQEMVELGNTKDANGEYIFAGNQAHVQPFSMDGAGNIVYQGDGEQREVSISSVRTIRLGDAGSTVFGGGGNELLKDGNGVFTVSPDPDADNTGSGIITSGIVTDAGEWDGNTSYRLVFEGEGDNLGYRVVAVDDGSPVFPVDEDGNPSQDPIAYKQGAAISFQGIQVQVSGSPNDGDAFVIRPSEPHSIFDGLNKLVKALEKGRSGGGTAPVNNAINQSLTEIDNMMEHLLSVRATVGTRLNAVESQAQLHGEQVLQLESTLSEIRDLDYAEAISRFSLQQVGLQAAQQSYVQVQRLSLFDYLR